MRADRPRCKGSRSDGSVVEEIGDEGEDVGTRPTDQRIHAQPARQRVPPVAADQPVVEVAPRDPIVAAAAQQRPAEPRAPRVDVVGALLAARGAGRIEEGRRDVLDRGEPDAPARQRFDIAGGEIDIGQRGDGIYARAAVDQSGAADVEKIVADVAIDLVAPVAAIERVVASAAAEHVVAGAAEDAVPLGPAIEGHAALHRRDVDGITLAGADQDLESGRGQRRRIRVQTDRGRRPRPFPSACRSVSCA